MDAAKMSNHPSILITGANGFTGQHACEYFSHAGYEVIATTRSKTNMSSNIQQEHLDLLNHKEVYHLISRTKPQYLLHLAGQNNVSDSWEDPLSTLEANVLSTAYLIDALHRINPSCKILIIGSSLQNQSITEYPSHPYSLSKALQSILAKGWSHLYNLHIMEAKPSNLIGPGYSNGVCALFAQKIVKMEQGKMQPMLEVHNLLASRDFLDVRDAVSAYDMIFQKGVAGETYDISSGELRSLGEIVNELKQLSTIGFSTKSANNMLGDQQKVISSHKIRQLGWENKIPFQTSIKSILDFYRQNEHNSLSL
ncbi:NAD-dependent epimerase/dehydratase family protein [Bacillus sp. B1-b2]|uniref:NAD-dependent epimerase/dehydratase family protein n=1 Tax=Bacillus sp. B1-b2 TaxID=2653201 RepID=UPI001D02155C|nr:NAD-dependent epimerase/dehydratase family protein [Bacillus sp. B1-b2]